MAEAAVAPPPAPAPAPAPAPPSEVPLLTKGPNMDAAFADLAKRGREADAKQSPVPPHPAQAKKEPPKPKADAPPAPVEEPVTDPVKPDEPPKPAEQPKAGEPPKQKRPSDILREQLNATKSERDALRKELETLKAPKEDPEKVELKTKWEAVNKQMKELENELRFSNYERSIEYRDKYLKPFQDAVQAGRGKVQSLDVVRRAIPDELGNDKVVQEGRPATAEDFDRLMFLPSDRDARQLAKQLFGEDAPIAMQHREKVLELNQLRQGVLDDYKKNGEAREKELNEIRSKQTSDFKKFQAELRKTNETSFLEKNPELAKVADDDKAGADILARDIQVTDLLFTDNDMSADKLTTLHAEMRNRAARFGYLQHLYRQQNKKLEEALTRLKEYEDTEPEAGDGAPSRTEPDVSNGTMASAMAGLAKIAKPRT
jgi:hypothetical protein